MEADMAFAADLVASAVRELALWEDNDLVECIRDPRSTQKPKKPVGNPMTQPGSKRVAEYWQGGLGERNFNGCTDLAWSAAFICWNMRQAGMRIEEFPFSSGHHAYIRWAINNTKGEKPGKAYYGRRLADYKPKAGDMIAQWRKSRKTDPDPNITFDRQPDDFYPSHCDIVVRTTDQQIFAIGGNVSDRVKENSFAASGGILSPKKSLICVLELRKT
jgi:hypothetical protein